MKRVRPFNRLEITSSELDYLQDVGQEGVKQRLLDGLYTPGIVIPPTATPNDIAAGVPAIFAISGNGTPNISVGGATISLSVPQVAYDKYGERITLPFNDTYSGATGANFNAQAPLFTTNTLSGFSGATPFSTGRLNVPASGNGVQETKYVFISYVPVTETVSMTTPPYLPPSHEGLSSDVTTASNRRLPITMVDQKQGIAYAHHRVDGYRVFIANSGDVDNAGVGSVPTIKSTAASGFAGVGEHYDAAIYIGKYAWTAGLIVTGVVSGSESSATGDKRPLMLSRSNPVAKVGDRVNLPAELTTDYAAGMWKTLQEHIGAVGHGVVSPNSPHGPDISDITNGTANPLQSLALDDGIIDLSNSSNPMTSSVLRGSITLAAVADYSMPTGGVIYQKGPSGQENYLPLGPAASGIFTDYVSILTPPSATTPLYLDGVSLTAIDTTQLHSGIPKVGFSAYDPRDVSGVWTIFARKMDQNVNPGYMTLGRSLASAGLGANDFAICNVYWDKVAGKLSRSQPKRLVGATPTIDNSVEDLRNFEVISKPQMSTEAMAHPVSGMFAQQALINIASNGDFQNALNTTTPDVWRMPAFTGKLGTGSFVYLTGTEITDAASGCLNVGPKTDKGANIALTRDGGTLTIRNKFSTYIPNALKKNTTYTISAWIYPDAAACTGLVIGARFGDSAGVNHTVMPPNSVSPAALDPISYVPFVFDRAATGWRRVSTTVNTNSLPDLSLGMSQATASWLDLFFEGANFGTASPTNVRVANVVVTEGEWVHTNVRPIESKPMTYRLLANHAVLTRPSGGAPASATMTLFNTGPIESKGQMCNIVCRVPHSRYVYHTNGNPIPAMGIHQGLAANLRVSNVLGTTTLDAKLDSERDEVNSPHNSYTYHKVLCLGWSGYLPAGTNTIDVNLEALNVTESYTPIFLGGTFLLREYIGNSFAGAAYYAGQNLATLEITLL